MQKLHDTLPFGLIFTFKVGIVSDLFKDQNEGFFIEAGAYDGEVYSNSLYFEIKRGWKGLLVEPNPDALADLVRIKT